MKIVLDFQNKGRKHNEKSELENKKCFCFRETQLASSQSRKPQIVLHKNTTPQKTLPVLVSFVFI